MKFTIEVGGRGGEVVIGTIQKEFYDFVYENDIDIADYAINSDFLEENDQLEAALESIQPFEPGNWYECDNIAHEYGPSTEDVYISVIDENGNIIHEALAIEQFLELGATLNQVADYYIVDQPKGTAVFVGQSFEKGHFGTYEIEADFFDSTKLEIVTTDVEGWELVTGLAYNSLYLEELGHLSTTGKGESFELIIAGEDLE
jgi:hypothetical protein